MRRQDDTSMTGPFYRVSKLLLDALRISTKMFVKNDVRVRLRLITPVTGIHPRSECASAWVPDGFPIVHPLRGNSRRMTGILVESERTRPVQSGHRMTTRSATKPSHWRSG